MRSVRATVCRVSQPWARNMAIAGAGPAPLLGRHTERCLRCQAEIAIENRIGRALANMEDHLLTAPADLMRAVMDGLDTSFPTSPRRLPKTAWAAVGLVGAASAVAWTVSRRVKSNA